MLRTASLVTVLCALAAPANLARAQSCTGDADCPTGMGCDFAPTGGAIPTCPREGECPMPEPEPERAGQCEAQTIACEEDGDCPTGLRCVEESGGSDSDGACIMSADGGIECEDEPEPVASTRACGFSLAECEQDSDCTQEGFGCIRARDSMKCDATEEPCSADGECPAPPDEDCMTEEFRVCFPARVDCVDDGDCDDGWSCFELPEDARDDLAEYADATTVCMPEGLVLAIEDRIELAEVESDGDGAGGGDDASDSGGLSDDEPRGGMGTTGGADEDDSAAPSGASGESASGSDAADDGCSVADVSSRRAGSAALTLVFGSLLALSQRRRARSL